MPGACLCQCSLKGVDVVEHESVGESRTTILARSRTPTGERLLWLACRLAEEVDARPFKVDGFAHYSEAFVASEAVEALRGFNHVSTLEAMEAAGHVRRVAVRDARGDDLYRFAQHVLAGKIKVMVQAVRLPAHVDKNVQTVTARARLRVDGAQWRSVELRRDPTVFTSVKPTFFEFPASVDVLHGAADEAPDLDVEVSWRDDNGVATTVATALRLRVINDSARLDVVNLVKAKAAQALSVITGEIVVLTERTYLEFLSGKALPLPPWRPLTGSRREQRSQSSFFSAPATLVKPLVRRALRRDPSTRLLRRGHGHGDDAPPATAQVRVLGVVAHDRAAPAGAAGQRDDAHPAGDDAPREWAAHVRLVDVRGVRLKTEGIVEVLGGDYVFTVEARLGPDGRGVKSAPRPKDWQIHGAEWAATGDGAAGRGASIDLRAVATRSRDVLRLDVHERLSTDLLETYSCGHVEIPLGDLPVVRDPADGREPPSCLRTFTIKRRPFFKERETDNGTLRAAVWLQPKTKESRKLRKALAGWQFGAAAVCAVLAAKAMVVPAVLVGGCAAALEAPRILGRALTWAVTKAAPGLDIAFERVSLGLSLWRADDAGNQDLRVAADVQGFVIGNAGPGYVRDFVAADHVRVVLRVPRELLHRACSMGWARLKWTCGIGRRSQRPRYSLVVSLDATLDAAKRTGAVLYAKVTTCGDDAVTLARTANVACDATGRATFPDLTIPVDAFDRPGLRGDVPGAVDVVAYRAVSGRADEYLGIATRLRVVDDVFDPKPKTVDAALRLHGTIAGAATLATAVVGELDDALEAGPGALRWSPYPSVHAKLRDEAPTEGRTRLCAVVVDDLAVKGGVVAFGMARNEFNVNAFERALAEGKVGRALPRGSKAPNLLRVRVLRGSGLPGARASVAVVVRDRRKTTATRILHCAEAIFEPDHVLELPCPDPSAVLRLEVRDEYLKPVARWIVTAKMLVLDGTNVHGRNVAPSLRRDAAGNAVYGLEGTMACRTLDAPSKKQGAVSLATELDVAIDYCFEPSAPTRLELLKAKPLTALQQLQMNSLETKLRLGRLDEVKHMLDDFPVLLDVRAFDVLDARLYISELFAGYRGAGDHQHTKFGHEALQRIIHPHRRLQSEEKRRRKQRGTAKPVGDYIYLDALDLKHAARLEGDMTIGAICASLLSTRVVRPIFKHLSLTGAASHLLTNGLLKKDAGSDDDDDDDGDGVGGGGRDARTPETRSRFASRRAPPRAKVASPRLSDPNLLRLSSADIVSQNFSSRSGEASPVGKTLNHLTAEKPLTWALQQHLLDRGMTGVLRMARTIYLQDGAGRATTHPHALRLPDGASTLFLTKIDPVDDTEQSRHGPTFVLDLRGARVVRGDDGLVVEVRSRHQHASRPGAFYLFVADDAAGHAAWEAALAAASGLEQRFEAAAEEEVQALPRSLSL